VTNQSQSESVEPAVVKEFFVERFISWSMSMRMVSEAKVHEQYDGPYLWYNNHYMRLI